MILRFRCSRYATLASEILNESEKLSSEASINAVKAVLGLAKEKGIVFYINNYIVAPNFIKVN